MGPNERGGSHHGPAVILFCKIHASRSQFENFLTKPLLSYKKNCKVGLFVRLLHIVIC